MSVLGLSGRRCRSAPCMGLRFRRSIARSTTAFARPVGETVACRGLGSASPTARTRTGSVLPLRPSRRPASNAREAQHRRTNRAMASARYCPRRGWSVASLRVHLPRRGMAETKLETMRGRRSRRSLVRARLHESARAATRVNSEQRRWPCDQKRRPERRPRSCAGRRHGSLPASGAAACAHGVRATSATSNGSKIACCSARIPPAQLQTLDESRGF
jgi:hypothetical protein